MTGEELENTEVVLESMAVNPFEGCNDWHGTEGEAVVTFETMKNALWRAWESQCVEIKKYDEDGGEILPEKFESSEQYFEASFEAKSSERVVSPENFDSENVQAPGIYRDGTYYDEEEAVDEAYTVIVPYSFLSPELCRSYIEKLNQKFERNFELKVKKKQKPPYSELERLRHMIEIDGEIEEAENQVKEIEKKVSGKMAAVLFKDGDVEDIAGEGKWHIEHLHGNLWYLGAELEGCYTKFHIRLDERGRITVEPFEESREHLEEVVEKRGGETGKEKPSEVEKS